MADKMILFIGIDRYNMQSIFFEKFLVGYNKNIGAAIS